jgi:glycogen debranching enzyme
VFSGDQVDLTLERYVTVPRGGDATSEYEDDLVRVRAEYDDFLAKVPSALDPADEPSRRLAAYITWSAVVGASGLLKRPAMYMSNNWMTNLWSWDNCFNALGLGKNQPRLAFDQLAIFNDFQDASGVLPDFVNDRSVSYACCKPPVQGWAWARLMELNEFFHRDEPVKEMYGQLKRLHGYWSTHRTSNSFPLPYYNHGNDSGWDNATVFARGCPVTSPDLPSYLVLLYETLEKMAGLLGLPAEAKEWKTAGETMLETLLANLWGGDSFRSYVHTEKAFITEGDCLINFMPLVIGRRLPGEVRTKLVEGLKTRGFLTPYGLATESVESPFYRTDGYWRGPVWAPVMLLIIDGLRRGGEEDFARDLSRRFRSAARKGGMAENFDAKTGEGLVDPAFTWTSSVFLHLASEAFYNE